MEVKDQNQSSGLFQTVGSFVTNALDFNKATLSGSLDIIVVRHDDGSLKSTPFHVRFGKLKVFRTRNKRVRIKCNGEETGLFMKLGDAGEAYFENVEEFVEGEEQEKDIQKLISQKSNSEKSKTILDMSVRTVLPTNQSSPSPTITDTGLKIMPNLEADGSITLDGQHIGNVENWITGSSFKTTSTTSPLEKTAEEVSDTLPIQTAPVFSSTLSSSSYIPNASKSTSRWSWMWGELPQKSKKISSETDKCDDDESGSGSLESADEKASTVNSNNRSQSVDRSIVITNSPKRALSAEATPRRSKMKDRRKQRQRQKASRLSRGRTGVLGSVVSFLAGKRSYLPEFSDSSSEDDDFLSDIRKSHFSTDSSSVISQNINKSTSDQIPLTDSGALERLVETRRRGRKWFNRRYSLHEEYEIPLSISKPQTTRNEREPQVYSPNDEHSGLFAPLPTFAPPWHASNRYSSTPALETKDLEDFSNTSPSMRRVTSLSQFEEGSKSLSSRKSRDDRSRRSLQNSSSLVYPVLSTQESSLKRSPSPHSPMSSPVLLRRCASSSPQYFSQKKRSLRSLHLPLTSIDASPLRRQMRSLSDSTLFSDVFQYLLNPPRSSKNEKVTMKKRAASLEISSLTRAQRESCQDAFGLWAIRMTTTMLHPHIKAPIVINSPESLSLQSVALSTIDSSETLSSSSNNGVSTIHTTETTPPFVQPSPTTYRRISKRERFLGWIPVIGPLVIPKDTRVENNPSIGSKKSIVSNSSAIHTDVVEGDGNSSASSISTSTRTTPSPHRSLVPTASQLRYLGKTLCDGKNRITFEVEGSEVKVESSLYVWSPHSKIVISDVDGTITKSDVLGHIFFYVGRDWTHLGVAQLYSSITANGYNIVYLTSRAIGQTDATRVYLQNIKQFAPGSSAASNASPLPAVSTTASVKNVDQISPSSSVSASASTNANMSPPSSFLNSTGGTSTDSHSKPVSPQQNIQESSLIEDKKNEPVFQLPPGPVITSPDRLFTAFTREVILRRPQEFKIAALRNILSLFPEGSSPIIAGFGNRDTDVLAYRAVGVPNGRIFIISPTGEVQTDNKTFQKTYEWINSHVDSIFPFCKQLASNINVGAKMGIPILENQNFTDTAFWKRTIPTLTLTDEADAGGISKKSVVIIKKQR
jgi:phosphatidate phosphatase PAH1